MMAELMLAAAIGCLAVEGDRITAADIARAEPLLAALPPETPLGYSPAPGARRVFRRAELVRLAARYGVSLAGGADVCVSRPLDLLSAERVLEAMRKTLGGTEARIEITELAKFPVPPGELEFPLSSLGRAPARDPLAAVLWRGSIRTPGGRRYPVWARVKIQAPCTRVLAAETLPAGRPIERAQLREEAAAGCPLADKLAGAVEEVAGKAPKRAIPAGAPIERTGLGDPQEVRRGETVQVEAVHGGARVSAIARAESGGRLGQTVSLRNPETGVLFRGRVTGKGRVQTGPAH